ncbi:hypothetical protein C7N43_35100 [Sphingobacteriales bacterium UPWRP_1]|nr:hypothetical protein C7N43_35100 [Sphingobacteriales bacterium UPWRP_1]
MKLYSLFDGPEKKKRLSHIKNLLALAMSDKSVDEKELELIFHIGAKAGLSHTELERILDNPESVTFYPPSTMQERIEQLFDLTMVMLADGEIDVRELLLCKVIAVKMNFKPEVIDLMVENLLDLVTRKVKREVAIAQLLQLLGRL